MENSMGWAGVLCLIGACALGSQNYTDSFLWFWEKNISFLPDLLSGLIAAGALLPLYRKGLLAASFVGVLAFIPLILVFYLSAVLANIGIGGNGWSLLKLPTTALTLFLLILANVNINKYAELALLVLLFLASFSLISASNAMGFSGFVFVSLSVAGILLVFDEKKVMREVLGVET